MHTKSLFAEIPADAPPTEGIKYAGSKLKLLAEILGLARRTNARTVLDGFAGTTRVSQAFARSGYKVVCNDKAVWTSIFGNCYLRSRRSLDEYRKLLNHLNSVPPREGWFTEHYGGCSQRSPNSESPKRPWQRHNTAKLDSIREEIEKIGLDDDYRAVALTSLIRALDQVDSTLGHYASYLRDWSPRSFNPLKLEMPLLIPEAVQQEHEVENRDVFDLISDTEVDLAYFDPPYGSNNEKMPPSRVRYMAYYHVWTTVCLNDRPAVFGKANRRVDTSDTVAGSVFEEFRQDDDGHFIAVNALKRLLTQTRAKWIILSYSSGGRATSAELHEAMCACGTVQEVVELDYKRNVMAAMKWTNEWLRDAEAPNREFLFLIKR
jgi:adenine-specific DNA-methyltransferase